LRYLTSAGYAVRVFQPFLRFWSANTVVAC